MRWITTHRRLVVAVVGALALTAFLAAWERVSQGASALVPIFTDRFNEVWQGPLGMRTTEPDTTPVHSAVPATPRVKVNAAEKRMTSPVLAKPPSRPAADGPEALRAAEELAALGAVNRVAAGAPTASPPSAPNFTLPDIGRVAVPTAAAGLTGLAVEEILRTKAPSLTGAPARATFAAPPPTATPLRLPGPFRLFVTTEPVVGGDDVADKAKGNGNANGSGNGNGNGNGGGNGNAGGNGNGNGVARSAAARAK